MKKTLLVILALTTIAASLPARNLSLALTASYLGKADSGFKEVYGSGGVMPGLRFEAAVWKGLSIYGSYGFFAKTGTTPVLAAEAKTSQHFLAAGAAWRGAMGEKLDWGVYAGLLYVIYREEALGEKVTGAPPAPRSAPAWNTRSRRGCSSSPSPPTCWPTIRSRETTSSWEASRPGWEREFVSSRQRRSAGRAGRLGITPWQPSPAVL